MRLISIGNFASGVIGAFLSLPSHFKILFLFTMFSSLFKTLHLLSFLNVCWLFLIKTLFPLQYFVAPRHKNHSDSIECFHYDDVFRHVWYRSHVETFHFWKWYMRRSVAFTFYSGNTFVMISWFHDFMISLTIWVFIIIF